MTTKQNTDRKSTSKTITKSIPSSVQKTLSEDVTEEDIFMDKGELLKEKLEKMNKDIDRIYEEIRQLEAYNNWLDLATEDKELQNQEVLRFVEKKEERKRNHSTTLGDYHAYNIEVLKHEREEMLRQSAEREKVLLEQLEEEKKHLEKCRDVLFQKNELQKVRKQQELEIEKLTRTARQLRTEFSQNVNQLKEELQHAADDLDRTGQMELKQSTMRAQQESIRLVVEKMQQIQDENRLLRDEIWTTRQNIHALEKHLDRVTEDHKQLRRINVQVMDLDYLEKKRLNGLLTLHHPNTDHIDQCL